MGISAKKHGVNFAVLTEIGLLHLPNTIQHLTTVWTHVMFFF